MMRNASPRQGAAGRRALAWRALAAPLALAFVLAAGLIVAGPGSVAAQTEGPREIAAYLSDDAEINEAIDRARRTLPRFVSIHQSRKDAPEALEFLALAAVDDGAGGLEYRWLTDVQLTPDAITGVLSEEGAESSPLKKGDAHRAEPDSIADWMVKTESGAVIGGYTLRVLVARSDEETRAFHEGRFLD